jgi:hypothetical protein
MCMYNRPLPDLGTADDRTFLTTNDRNTGSSRPIKCIAHKISRPQHHGFWHGYALREEGTHCILLIAHIALCKSLFTPAHCISLIVYLTSYTIRLTSYVLHLTSYVLHLTSYTLHLTSYVLRLTSYALHLTSYTLRLTSYTLHLTPYILRLTSYTLRLTSYTLRLTSYILHLTSYIISYSVTCDMYTSCV